MQTISLLLAHNWIFSLYEDMWLNLSESSLDLFFRHICTITIITIEIAIIQIIKINNSCILEKDLPLIMLTLYNKLTYHEDVLTFYTIKDKNYNKPLSSLK